MIVSNDLLARLRAVRELRNGGVDYKSVKAQVYTDIRTKYGIPADVKLSVELDGPQAGELRVKGTGQPYVPLSSGGTVVGAVAGTQRFMIISDDDESIVDSIDGLFATLREDFGIRIRAI